MILLFALFGLAAGIAVNYVADRALQLMRDQEHALLLRDRRLCTQCGQPTRERAEFALWRFAARGGRCAQCGARLPLRPVLVELAGLLIFAYLWAHDVAPAWRYAGTADYLRLALHSVWLSVFLLVVITDLEHHLILDAMIYPAIALALVPALLNVLGFPVELSWRAILFGGALALVFFAIAIWLGDRFVGAGALGGGDLTLGVFIGLITGFPTVVVALMLGIFTGGLILVALLVLGIVKRRTAVPYGPFLVFGGVAALLWGPQIVEWYFGR